MFGYTHFGEPPKLSDGFASDRSTLDAVAAAYASANRLELCGSTSVDSLRGKYYDLCPVEPCYAVNRSGRRIPTVEYLAPIGVFVGDDGSCAAFTVEEVLNALGEMIGANQSAEYAIAQMVASATVPRAWGTYEVCVACGWQRSTSNTTDVVSPCPRCGGTLEHRVEGPLGGQGADAV